MHNAVNSSYIFTLHLCGSHQMLHFLFRTMLVEKTGITAVKSTWQYEFWIFFWLPFLKLQEVFILYTPKSQPRGKVFWLPVRKLMNYSDFPSTLWAGFSSSIMQIKTAARFSTPNLSCFILHTQIYISLCTGIKKIRCNTHMKCWDKHVTRRQNMLDKETHI